MPSRNGDLSDGLGGDGSIGEIQVFPFAHQGKDKVINVQVALSESLNILAPSIAESVGFPLPSSHREAQKIPDQ